MNRDPRRVRGVSAFALRRIVAVWIGTLLVFYLSLFFSFAGGWSSIGSTFLPLANLGLFAPWLFIWQNNREARRGYTSLPLHNLDLDYIDRHGTVKRAALERSEPAPTDYGTLNMDSGFSAVPITMRPAHVVFGVARVWISIAVVVVLFAAGVTLNERESQYGWEAGADAFGLTTIALLFLFLVLLAAFAVLPPARYRETLQTAFPEGHAFAVKIGNGFEAHTMMLTKPLGLPAPGRIRSTSFALIAGDRITFWSRSGLALVPFLSIPRSHIRSATIGTKGAAPVSLVVDNYVGQAAEFAINVIPADRGVTFLPVTVGHRTIADWAATGTLPLTREPQLA